MKAAAFLLVFVAAFFVKGSIAEVGAGILATSLHLHRHLNKGAVSTGAQRTEPQGAKRRSLHQITRVSGSAEDIEGTWVGLSDPTHVILGNLPTQHERLGTTPLICPSEAKSRGFCVDDVQVTFEIDGGDFRYESGSSSCGRCGSTVGGENGTAIEGQRQSGTVTAFKNNRLEITLTDEDLFDEFGTISFPVGRRIGCINMEVFVEGGQVFAAARIQKILEGTLADITGYLLNNAFSMCTPEPITCKIDLGSSTKNVLRLSQQTRLQCVSGKCLELAGANGIVPASLDPCDLE